MCSNVLVAGHLHLLAEHLIDAGADLFVRQELPSDPDKVGTGGPRKGDFGIKRRARARDR